MIRPEFSCRLPLATLACLSGLVVPVDAASAQEDPSRFFAATGPRMPAEQQAQFRLPPGFEIELVAAEPQIRKPINMRFDARGRLLVSSSVEYPFPVPPGRASRDRIYVLEDANRDGRYESVSEFAESLNMPIGLTPTTHGVVAYSIPDIELLKDTDGDGRADDRQRLYGPFDYRDTHGMPNGFLHWIDGWIYGCQGQSNEARVSGRDGNVLALSGGATFRFRPDGSRIEGFAWGQANPFGLCFDPWGNLYTADSNSRPGTLVQRGAWYPTLGTPHDGLGFAPPMMSHYHGSTGIAGIACYAADQFPEAYRGTLFIGNPVTGRINHDRIEWRGSSARAIELPDFVSCGDPWFRPVDLQLGPDGALYIADFYNRIIEHTLAPLNEDSRDRERGRIWRVVYRGLERSATLATTPDLQVASLDQLLNVLGDANLVLRTQATHQLVERIGQPAIEPLQRLLQQPSRPWQRAHAVWTLHRLQALDDAAVKRLAVDPDPAVRVHLVRILAETPSNLTIRQWLVERLQDSEPLARRVAAESLAQHPSSENVKPLLTLWANAPSDDLMLVHSVRIALRASLQTQSDFAALARDIAAEREDVRRLADVSLGVRTPAAAAFLTEQLQYGTVESRRLEDAVYHAARFASADLLPKLDRIVNAFRERATAEQGAVLRALHRAASERSARLSAEARRWSVELARSLVASENFRSRLEGLELVWDLELEELAPQVVGLALAPEADPAVRSLAIDALAATEKTRAIDPLARLLADVGESVAIRAKAGETLGKIQDDRSRVILIERLADAPQPVTQALARVLALSEPGADALLRTISQGKADPRLLQDPVVDQHLLMLEGADLQERRRRLLQELPPANVELDRLIAQRRMGMAAAVADPIRGEALFTTHCRICHRLAGEGTDAGPALDGIGLRGVDRLLEDLLLPHQVVDELYRSSTLLLEDGRILTGLVVRQDGDTTALVDSQGKEILVPTREIEVRQVSKLSPMPTDAASKLTEQEFYDLMSFLLQQRTAAVKNGD